MSQDLKPPIRWCGLYLLASKEVHEQLQELAYELGSTFASGHFPVHVTLGGFLNYTQEEEEIVKSLAPQIARSTPALEAEITGVGMRNQYFQAAFLTIAPTQGLMSLRNHVCTALGQQTDQPYMPHVSMIYGDFDWQTKRRILDHLVDSMLFPHIITLNRLVFARCDGFPNEWRFEQEWQLQS